MVQIQIIILSYLVVINLIAFVLYGIDKKSDINIVVEYKSRIPRRYKQDIMNLTAKYGDLNNLRGQTISSTRRDFSSICQRDSPKVASYNGLAKFLGENTISRWILSRRKASNNKNKQGTRELNLWLLLLFVLSETCL